jgi:hypothetical protein
MQLDAAAWYLAPFAALGVFAIVERLLLRRGWIPAHRFGLPIGGRSEHLGIEVPARLVPNPHGVRDDIARGAGGFGHVRVRWLDDDLLAFWDDRGRGGVEVSALLVHGLVTIDRSGGESGTVLRLQRIVRPLPWLTVVAVLVSAGLLERAWNLPPDIKWWGFAMFAVFEAIHTTVTVQRLDHAFDTLRVALVERVQSGEAWVGPAELERAVGNPLDR